MRLSLDEWEGIGLLEAVWLFTGRFARQGDIGRWTNEQIARGIKWRRTEPDVMVEALTEEKWIDRNEKHRLIVHDWPTYADDALHMSLARAGELFADGTVPKMNRLSGDERREIAKRFRAHGVRVSAHKGARRGGSTVQDSTGPDGTSPKGEDELALWLRNDFEPRYPKDRRVQAKTALAELRKLKPSTELRAEIIGALAVWCASGDWHDEGGKYVPGMGKFFADRKWERKPRNGGRLGTSGENRNGNGTGHGDGYEADRERRERRQRQLGLGPSAPAREGVSPLRTGAA